MSGIPVIVLVMSTDHTAEIKGADATIADLRRQFEIEIILAAHRSEGTWVRAARALGMTREGLAKKRKRLGL